MDEKTWSENDYRQEILDLNEKIKKITADNDSEIKKIITKKNSEINRLRERIDKNNSITQDYKDKYIFLNLNIPYYFLSKIEIFDL